MYKKEVILNKLRQLRKRRDNFSEFPSLLKSNLIKDDDANLDVPGLIDNACDSNAYHSSAGPEKSIEIRPLTENGFVNQISGSEKSPDIPRLSKASELELVKNVIILLY